MKRAMLVGGVLASTWVGPALAENMLQWCVKSYPGRVDWCRSQYPGTIEPPAGGQPQAEATTSAAPTGSKFATLLPTIAGRGDAKVRTFALSTKGSFDGSAAQISEAVRTAVAYAGIKLADDDCNDLYEARTQCTSSDDDVTVMVRQPTGSQSVNEVEVELMVTSEATRTRELFALAVTIDALSRMLDPNLSDDERAGVLSRVGASYFDSNRTKGRAIGKQADYTFVENDGTLVVTITPFQGTGPMLTKQPTNPVLALTTALDRDDILKPDPLEAPAIKARMAEQRVLARQLLTQLDRFRYERRFHAVGFMGPQPYHGWLRSVQTISAVTGDDILRQAGVRYGSLSAGLALYNMAMEYMHNEGQDTEESVRSRKDVMKFLDGNGR